LLLPNRAADPRWGYLDRFEDNPYLPRALAVTAFVALLAVAVPRPVEPPEAPLTWSSRPVVIDVIDVMPSVQVITANVVAPRPPQVEAIVNRRPVPLDVEPQVVEDPVQTGATSTSEVGPTTTDVGASDIATGTGPGTSAWPEPDDFIPVESQPVLVAMQKVPYPDIAREAGIEGTVLVRVLVGEDGFVRRALVAQSVLGLDEAALAAAHDAVFKPALQQERPVAVWVVIPIEFRLRD
jgi:protein TonB